MVDVLEAGGNDVVAMSRSSVECVVDVATGPSPQQDAATEFFTAAARNLQQAGERAGVRRMVVVSIIGADRYSTGYNAAKVVHERAHLDGPIPAHVLRAAQFHEFVEELMEWGRQGQVSYLPKMRTQPVAASSRWRRCSRPGAVTRCESRP